VRKAHLAKTALLDRAPACARVYETCYLQPYQTVWQASTLSEAARLSKMWEQANSINASQFSAFFDQRVRRLRRLTNHEIVRSTIHLLAGQTSFEDSSLDGRSEPFCLGLTLRCARCSPQNLQTPSTHLSDRLSQRTRALFFVPRTLENHRDYKFHG
jgi:hypothetical protein